MSHEAKRNKQMIIEFFGPSGVGKTTLTYALSDALQASGHSVQLVVSSRPAERRTDDHHRAAASARFSRVLAPLSRAAKIVDALSTLQDARSDETSIQLMKLLTPRSTFWTIRYKRYLTQLYRSWSEARSSSSIVIFDQAYLTALCALALLAKPADRAVLEHGLSLLPKPDLLVRLDAPRALLELRLRERLQQQGMFERLFEFDLQTNLQQIDVADEVTGLLHEQGRPMIHISSVDTGSLQAAIKAIMREADMMAGGEVA